MNLEYLLKPKKIAIIGASDSDGFGGAVTKTLEATMSKDEFAKNIFYVNKKRDTLRGIKCYKEISDIESDIDLLVIATNKNTVIDVIKEGAKKNVKAAVVYASGFSECEDGVALEEELKKVSEELGILIMGPNCAGFSNYINNLSLFAFLSEPRDRKGNIGVVSQSGMIGLSMLDNQMMKFSYNISCGNANIIKFTDYVDFLIDDKDTKIIGLYVDAIKDIVSFEKVIKKAKEVNKRVVLFKMGNSEKSKLISKFHTGSVEEFDKKSFDELLKKYDVVSVGDLEEFIYTLMMLSYTPQIVNCKNIASINLSGGEANIIAEVGNAYDMSFPEFSDSTKKYLIDRLPSYAHISNPLDMTVTLSYDSEAFADALYKLMDENDIDNIVIGYTLLRHIDDPCIYYMIEAIKILKERRKDRTKPISIISFFSCSRDDECINELLKLGVIVLPTPIYAFKILKNIMKNK